MNYKWIVNIGVLVLIATEIFSQNTRKFSLETTDSLPEVYAPTGKMPEIVVQEASSGPVTILQYTSDGKYLLAGTFSDVKIYDAKSNYLLKSFEGVSCKGFSPDGKYFVSLSYSENDYGIKITNIETGKSKIIGEINHNHSNYVRSYTNFAFSPNGKYLAVPMVDWVDIYYVETFEQKEVLKTSLLKDFQINGIKGWHFYDEITWSPNSKFISCITGFNENSDYNLVYEIIHGYVENLIVINKYSLKFPSFSPVGNRVAFSAEYNGKDRSIYILNLEKDMSPNKFQIKGEKVCGLSFTPDGSELIVLHESSYSRFKASDNWEHGEKKGLGRKGVSTSFVISPDATKFLRGINREIEIFDMKNGDFIKSLKGNSKIEKIHQNTDNFNFYVSSDKIDVSAVFDENLKKIRDLKNLSEKNITVHNIATFNGGFYHHETNSSKIMRYNDSTETSKEICDLGRNVSEIGIVSSYDGKTIAVLDDEKKLIKFYRDTRDGFSKFNSIFVKSANIFGSCFNHNESLFFNGVGSDKDSDLIVVNEGRIFASVYDILQVAFSNDGLYFALYSGSGKTLVWNTKEGKFVKTFDYFNALPFFSNDSKKLAMYSLDNKSGKLGIDIYDVTSWKKIQRLNAPHRYNKACFSKDESKVFILDVAGIVRCYSANTGELLVSFMMDDEGNYFTYTPEGYFTGSPGGINKFVHLVDGMQVFELGQLYDTLYRPDLVQAKLEGKDIGENPLKKIVATGDAPRVQFTQAPMATARNVKVEFSVQDTGGGIGYVYLSQNGKAMQVSSGEKSKAGQRYIYTCDVTLAKGENVFEAYAANSANKIESRHVSSTLSWQGKVEDSNLYVLAIGVDKYIKMPQNNLKYSVADATGIIESFKASPGGLYGSVNVMTLLDSDVSKDNIQKAFETFASKVKPDDMFVLHLAGHGVNYGGEYYYLPSDTLAKSDSDYPKVGVSKHFLTESLSEIQSLNTIILLDTCYSGAFIDAKAEGNELAQKTALEHLAHTSGQVILTASANSQTAAEGYKGHGIFTYAIMEAISGKANYNADSTLSIKEITQYVGYEVPNIYEKMGLARQSPWNSPLRGDFSVVATGNRQSPQFHEVSLDGGKRTDWVTVRTDDSDVGNFENALASAKKEAKKTQKSAKTEKTKVSSSGNQRTRRGDVIGISIDLGKATGPFYSGFDYDTQLYLFGGKHVFGGIDADMIFAGLDGDYKSMSETKSLYFWDFNFLLGCSFNFWKFRPYVMGGAGYYFSVVSNSQDSAPSGFTWDVRLGLDLAFKHFFVGGQYKLKNFTDSGYVDVWTISIGGSF